MNIYTPSKKETKELVEYFGYHSIDYPSPEELKREGCELASGWGDERFQQMATEAARLVNTGKKQCKEHKLKRAIAKSRSVIVNGIEYKSQKEAAINNNVLPSVICELIKLYGRNITLEKGNLICPHCGKGGKNSRAMKRWHYDNCKKKG